MVGIAGFCGARNGSIRELVADHEQYGGEKSTTFEDDALSVGVSQHPHNAESQPLELDDGSRMWLWGTLYGHETAASVYSAKCDSAPELTDLEYAGRLYDRHGLEFVHGLNGEFFFVHADDSTISFVTNRLGTRPVYFHQNEDGLAFSSAIQSLPSQPGAPAEFEPDYLTEYLSMRRSFGVRTPLRDIELFHPGAITEYNLETGELTRGVYWVPEYRPRKRPYREGKRDYERAFKHAVREREAEGESGLLLSAGNDSRAILSLMDDPPQAFHRTTWSDSPETQTVRRVADAAGAPLRLLHYATEQLPDELERNSQLSNFMSWFNQAHVYGFADELRDGADVLFTGHYGGFWSGVTLPTYSVPIPGERPLPIPIHSPISTIDEYVDAHLNGEFSRHSTRKPDYVNTSRSLESILRENISVENGGINNHGVWYPSLKSMTYSFLYPITNRPTFLFYESLVQTMPTANPFFDNRMIDFLLSSPIGYQLRHDLQDSVISQNSTALANIPHASRGIAPKWPWPIQFLAHKAHAFYRHNVSQLASTGQNQIGWTVDHGALICESSFVEDELTEHRNVIDAVDLLSYRGVENEFSVHCEGKGGRRSEIYTLLTLLNMPIVQRIADSKRIVEARE